MKYRIPFIKPDLPSSIEMGQLYDAIVDSNWFTNFGPMERKLSAQIAEYVGPGIHATTVSNATSGLMLAVAALMGKAPTERRKVLLPSFTFAAGPEALIWCGLEPVFVDIDSDTLQPNFQDAQDYVAAHYTELAGILFCNIFGVGDPDITKWEELAKQYQLSLIIDSAAGFGSKYVDDYNLGSKGDCEIFSFHATKPFGVGEGGAITSKSAELIARLRTMENFGFNAERQVQDIGMNAKLQEINAAIGLWQMERLAPMLTLRQRILTTYSNKLKPLGFHIQPNMEKSTVCFVSVVAPSAKVADRLFMDLRENGIEVNRYYNPPLHHQAAFKMYETVGSMPHTNDICQRIISLPAHQDVTDADIKFIGERAEANLR